MKPIASRKNGWVVQPTSISSGIYGTVYVMADGEKPRAAILPDGLTFAQFLDQYAACAGPIYFID